MLTRHTHGGKFIAFEGMDGCGKSTQLKLAVNTWEMAQTTKEPNRDLPSGKLIYGLLFGNHKIAFSEMGQRERQRYYFINRMEHYQRTVIPKLQAHVMLFSDRSLASVCLDVNNEDDLRILLAEEADFFEMGEVPFITPDLILIYDVPTEVALERLMQKPEQRDFFERKDRITRTREAYIRFAKNFSSTCQVIDAREDAQTVYEKPGGTRDSIQKFLAAWPFTPR